MLGARSPGRRRSRWDAAAGRGRCLGYSVGRGPPDAPARLRSPARTAPHRLPRTSRDWPTSPTNGGPPPPASLERGRRGQLKGGGRSAPPGAGLRPRSPPSRLAGSKRPLLQARRSRQRRRRPAPQWESPWLPGASQRPGVRVNFQASACGQQRGGKPTRVDPWLIHRLLLPPPWLQTPRAQVAGRTPPFDAGGSLGAPVPEKGGPPPPTPASSSLTLQLPTPVGLTSPLLPSWEQSRLRAKFELTRCAVRKKVGNVPWQSLGILNNFLDSHQLLFTSIFYTGFS